MGGLDQEAKSAHFDEPTTHPDPQTPDVEVLSHWFDADGQPCDPADAVTGELIELIGGYEVKRTYIDRRQDGREGILVVPAEESALDPESQDDLKSTTWDIWWVDDAGQYRLVETMEQWFQVMGITGSLTDQRRKVGHLLEVPSWIPAPQSLKDEVYAWLRATRQE